MTPLEALTESYYLTAPYDLVSFASFTSVTDMLVFLTVAGAPVSQEILEAAIKVQSILSKMRPSAKTEHRDVINRISDSTSQLLKPNLLQI